jgi:hypothetical protein
MPIAALLAIDHPFGLLFYAALVAGLTFGADPINWRRSAGERERLFRAGVAASWCLVPLLTLLIFAPALPGADTQAVALSYGRLAYRLAALLTPLSSYSIVIAAIFTLTLSGSIFWLARRGLLLMHGGLLLATVGLVVAALLVPDQAGGGSWISRRMPTMVLLALLAALQIDPRVKVRLGRGIAIAAFAMVAAQAAWISWCWHGLDANITTVKRVLASVPAGSTVLPMQHDPNLQIRANASGGRYVTGVGDPTFRHDASLATPLRRAFVPSLFSARGLQPLQVHGPWARFVEHNGGELASVSALGRPGLPTDPVYLKGWRARFDYILVLNADLPDAGGEFIPPKGLHLVSNAGFAQLWRIDHPEQ